MPFGVYRFKVMPFGLRNAESTFHFLFGEQDTVNTLLPSVACHMDEFALLSKAYKAYLTQMRQLLG